MAGDRALNNYAGWSTAHCSKEKRTPPRETVALLKKRGNFEKRKWRNSSPNLRTRTDFRFSLSDFSVSAFQFFRIFLPQPSSFEIDHVGTGDGFILGDADEVDFKGVGRAHRFISYERKSICARIEH